MPNEARAAARKIKELKPNISLRFLKTVLRYDNPAHFEHEVEGLRKAGLDISDEPAAYA